MDETRTNKDVIATSDRIRIDVYIRDNRVVSSSPPEFRRPELYPYLEALMTGSDMVSVCGANGENRTYRKIGDTTIMNINGLPSSQLVDGKYPGPTRRLIYEIHKVEKL